MGEIGFIMGRPDFGGVLATPVIPLSWLAHYGDGKKCDGFYTKTASILNYRPLKFREAEKLQVQDS